MLRTIAFSVALAMATAIGLPSQAGEPTCAATTRVVVEPTCSAPEHVYYSHCGCRETLLDDFHPLRTVKRAIERTVDVFYVPEHCHAEHGCEATCRAEEPCHHVEHYERCHRVEWVHPHCGSEPTCEAAPSAPQSAPHPGKPTAYDPTQSSAPPLPLAPVKSAATSPY